MSESQTAAGETQETEPDALDMVLAKIEKQSASRTSATPKQDAKSDTAKESDGKPSETADGEVEESATAPDRQTTDQLPKKLLDAAKWAHRTEEDVLTMTDKERELFLAAHDEHQRAASRWGNEKKKLMDERQQLLDRLESGRSDGQTASDTDGTTDAGDRQDVPVTDLFDETGFLDEEKVSKAFQSMMAKIDTLTNELTTVRRGERDASIASEAHVEAQFFASLPKSEFDGYAPDSEDGQEVIEQARMLREAAQAKGRDMDYAKALEVALNVYAPDLVARRLERQAKDRVRKHNDSSERPSRGTAARQASMKDASDEAFAKFEERWGVRLPE